MGEPLSYQSSPELAGKFYFDYHFRILNQIATADDGIVNATHLQPIPLVCSL